MADSLLDLGTTTLWYPDNIINWRKAPVVDFDISKTIHGYQGTIQEFLLTSEDTPRKWEFEVLNPSKQAEYELLEAFLYTFQARKKRFWFPLPVSVFVLYSFIAGDATTVTIKENGLDYKSWERFFMKLKNGDKITRHITAIERFPVTKTISLTVDNMPVTPIYPSDVEFFGFLPLCRFDQDVIKLKMANHFVSVVTVKLQELLEHSEA